MKTRLLAEMIYSAVVYGQGTKRQIIDKIASMLEADRTARMEAAEAIETLAHAAMSGYAMTPARVSELVELVRNSYKLPPEPRTCETCGTGCSNRGAKVVGLDLNESKSCPEWTPRSPQSADVETVRNAISSAIVFVQKLRYRGIVDDWSGESGLSKALAALDRIVGKEE